MKNYEPLEQENKGEMKTSKGVKKMDEEWVKKWVKTENQILTCKLTGLHARREEFTNDGLFKKIPNRIHKNAELRK